jgi:hypothetical protein
MSHPKPNWLLLLTAVLFLAGNAAAWQESTKTAEVESAKKAQLVDLLELLKEQNRGQDRFREAWCITLIDIIEIGPVGVPQLIAELDATNDDMMLRCMGFTLRAIGDKRAVPALIRAIPKTLKKPGSDMGLRSDHVEISEFMQKHDLAEKDEPNEFDFGRPVREIHGALGKLTGQSFEDDELFHIFLDGTILQRRMKEEFFFRHAQQWAAWWEKHAAEQVKDEAFFKVNLVKPAAMQEVKLEKKNSQHYRIESGSSGWLLESFTDTKGKHIFYDFDTGRTAKLPGKWRDTKDLNSRFPEIEKWAREEGFDIMGAEYILPLTGKAHLALRPLGLEAWELGEKRWKMESSDVTFESLIVEGNSVSGWLLHRDSDNLRFEPEEIATFLFRTKEGTPGLIFVGVEVHDDSQRPGGIMLANEDLELSPISFSKGRRFGFNLFVELEDQK